MNNRFKALVLLLLLVTLSMDLTGCATLFNHRMKNVAFNSEPSGATVLADGIVIGKTPLIAPIKQRKDHLIEFKLKGYTPASSLLTSSMGPIWLILDLLTGYAAPLYILIDAASASWNYLDQSSVKVALEPLNP